MVISLGVTQQIKIPDGNIVIFHSAKLKRVVLVAVQNVWSLTRTAKKTNEAKDILAQYQKQDLEKLANHGHPKNPTNTATPELRIIVETQEEQVKDCGVIQLIQIHDGSGVIFLHAQKQPDTV